MAIGEISNFNLDPVLVGAIPLLLQAAIAFVLLSAFATWRKKSRVVGADDNASTRASGSTQQTIKSMQNEMQWSRVSDVLNSAISGAQSARELQTAASRQVDAAGYAMQGIFDELSAVMKLPAASVAQVIPLASNSSAPVSQRDTLAA